MGVEAEPEAMVVELGVWEAGGLVSISTNGTGLLEPRTEVFFVAGPGSEATSFGSMVALAEG